MPSIGRRCHELRIVDENKTWRIVYRVDEDAILILEVFAKKATKTTKSVIEICKDRARRYDSESNRLKSITGGKNGSRRPICEFRLAV